jgi:hypothetical protein
MLEVSPDADRAAPSVDSSAEVPSGDAVRSPAAWIYGGFGIGIVMGFVITAVQIGDDGYQILPFHLVWNLIWAPFLGAMMGLGYSRRGQTGPRKWSRPQLRTRDLMAAIAYLGLLLGMGISTLEIGNNARKYNQKALNSVEFAKVHRELGVKSEADTKLKRANVLGLRAGKIPDGLFQGQREFLQGLEDDAKVTPEYRKYRRDLILESEERDVSRHDLNVIMLRKRVEYFEGLADKYKRARKRPWLPVEPDPPIPEW